MLYKTLDRIIGVLFGKIQIGQEIQWDDNVPQEEKNKFITNLIAYMPTAERMYQGINGGGIPVPSSMIKYLMKEIYKEKNAK